MKLLTFLVSRFSWKTFKKTLPDAPECDVDESVENAVVVFMHIEKRDQGIEERKRAFKHTLKHIKWIANKRNWRRIVLHSFTHLGGDSAQPDFARALMEELGERLRSTGYEVHLTPFGYFCSWNIDVLGESLAKVWKEI